MPIIDFKNVNKTIRKNSSNNGYGIIRKNAKVPYGTFSKYGNNKAVYGIKSKTTNKIYIGSTKHIQERLMKHFNELFHNRHTNKRLQIDFKIIDENTRVLVLKPYGEKYEDLVNSVL